MTTPMLASAAASGDSATLSTGPTTPASVQTMSTSPVTAAASAQSDAPDVMQVDSDAADASTGASRSDDVTPASIPLGPVGPFTLAPDKLARLGRAQVGSPNVPTTSGEKRPLEVVSSPAGPSAASVDPDKRTAEPPKKKARKSAGPKVVTQYCHQDHQPHDISKVTLLRCTAQKVAGKSRPGSTEVPTRLCSLSYCERCLSNRYREDVQAIKAAGADATWTCPSCRGECNCSTCRKKAGLDATGPLKELGITPGTPSDITIGPVTGGRSAAAAARSKMSASFTASGKVAAMSLTQDGPSGSVVLPGMKKAKAKKSKKRVGGVPSVQGSLSDSSLSELTDSDEEPSVSKKGKGKAKAASGSPAPLGGAGPKRVMPPRAPRDLPAPPHSHALASVWAPSPVLPCDESIRARLHLREFFLRFLPCMPPLDPAQPAKSSKSGKSGKSSSSRASTKAQALSPHLARVLSALSDDVLWLWRDRDSAAEAVQLRLLQGLCELLLREKPYTGQIHKVQREYLEDLRVELRTALAGVQRQREVFDCPWRTAKKVAEGGLGAYWVEEGEKWQKDVSERRQRAEAQRKAAGGGGGAAGSEADGDESELSSIASSDEDEGASAKTGGDDDDDEVDQLASDYEEPPPKLDKAGRRMKGERDMPGEERLAVMCALIELASGTEAVRAEIAQGADLQYAEHVALRKKRIDQRKELSAEEARLEASKPEKPTGNSISLKVKEWQDECDAIDDKIKQAAEDAVHNAWCLQHEFFLAGAKHRVRFASIGTDAHGTVYYTPAPPPDELLQSTTGALTSGFPLDRKPSDDGVRDYPLSWCIVGHGRRPAAVGAAAVKMEDGEDGQTEWFVVRGVDDLAALAEWVDLSARHADHALRLAEFQLEHPKTKTGGIVRPPPTQAELAAFELAAERADAELPDRLRQFADAIKWRQELARREEDGDGAMAERTRAHKA